MPHLVWIAALLACTSAAAQTTHPLLLQMQENARRTEYGSYYIEAWEQYPYSQDSIFYSGHCAFARFEHFDGKPGVRFDVDMETRFPRQTSRQRVVFDGRMKYDLRSDTLLMLYDSRELGDEYVLRGLQYFFFIPLLLHPAQAQKFLGPDKYFGTPPYETLGDTLIGHTPCTLVGADWALDSINHQHIRFALSKETGLPVFFSHAAETRPEYEKAPPKFHRLQIRVQDWSPALPVNSFYIDWPSMAPTFEVRHFHDCYHRELLRERNQPDL
ncbi:MAG: hypothetical protein IPH12_03980 [Saprospirales bacterium]|nr:hypothetical protein [Saprospirales bacterium]MBK8922568.1 hypothetical protein [Saprospirales bacterium]